LNQFRVMRLTREPCADGSGKETAAIKRLSWQLEAALRMHLVCSVALSKSRTGGAKNGCCQRKAMWARVSRRTAPDVDPPRTVTTEEERMIVTFRTKATGELIMLG